MNEDGEFELVLGNKQLLSIFFLVVLLNGVFFSMGYIVGRSTAPASVAQMGSGGRPPIVVEPAGTTTVASNRLPDPGKPAPSIAEPERPKPSPPITAPPPKPEPVRPEPVPPKPEPAKPPQPAPAAEAGRGSYLQVAATRKAEAELLMESLHKKGFSTATMPVPDSTLLRVLVGPYADAAAMSDARAKLKDLGISAPIPRKL